MSFGYIGDTSTSVKQQVKNKGILTTQESFDLERQGFLGGSLELIQSQTASSSSALDFTNLGNFDVHLFTGHNINMSANNQFFKARLSNDGGSSFISSASYDRAGMRQLSTGTFSEQRGTGKTFFGHNLTDNSGGYSSTADNGNFYLFCYDLLNPNKFSFCSSQSTGLEQSSSTYSSMFGGGVCFVAETHNAIRFLNQTSGTFSGVINCYGVKK
jgi:hypothetical protein